MSRLKGGRFIDEEIGRGDEIDEDLVMGASLNGLGLLDECAITGMYTLQ